MEVTLIYTLFFSQPIKDFCHQVTIVKHKYIKTADGSKLWSNILVSETPMYFTIFCKDYF